MIEAELPDGTILEFPDGTEPQVMQAAVKRYMAKNQQPMAQQIAPDTVPQEQSYLQGLARDFAQGVTFGFGDELGAALAAPTAYALKNLLPESMGGENVSFGQVWDATKAARQAENQQMAQFQQQNPVSSALAQMAGGVGTGIGVTKLAQAAAPQTMGALAKFAAANPYTAAAGIGGGSGYLYGLGTGEGDIGERATQAIPSGVGGAVLGPAAAYVGRNIIQPMVAKGGNALSAIGERFGVSPSRAVAEVAPEGTGVVTRPSGEIFSKTAGERTQSSATQTLEADALSRRYGEETAAYMRHIRNIQNQERKDFLNAISKETTSDTGLDEILDRVSTRVQSDAEVLNKKISNAYDIARNGNKVKIDSGDLRTGLMHEIGNIRRDMAINLSDAANYGKARQVVKSLGKKIASPNAKITAVKLGDLEDWRKTLTNYANDAQGSEKAFLSKVRDAYDNFMVKTANEAVESSDADAINAFRNAVGLRREYGRLFQSNKIVEDVANGKSVDDFAKDLFGSGAIGGKRNMLENARALIKAGGENGDAVKQDIGAALMKRAYNRSISGFQEGSQEVFVSPETMAKELNDIFVKNTELAREIYGQETVKMARNAIKELNLIAKKQPATQNPSGSGQMIVRVMRDTGLTNAPSIGIINNMFSGISNIKKSRELQQGLKDFVNAKTEVKSPLFSNIPAAAAGVGAASVINSNNER